MSKIEELAALKAECLACRRCAIGGQMVEGRFLSNVFSNMNCGAEYMVVGQNPGRDETEREEPFVGISGRMFDQLMDEVLGMKRSQFYISNCVRCLRYNSKVLLADGSWRTISRLVREKYDGEVVSINEHGQMENQDVVGWYKSPVAGRSVYKLSYGGAKGSRHGMVGPMVTGDHQVLTKDGYKQVRDLDDDDVIAIGEPHPNDVLMDVIVGSLLGDAHLCRKSARLEETHSAMQKDYVLFKQRCLRHFGCKYDEYESDGEKKSRIVTASFRFFAQGRKKFYPSGMKTVWAVGSLSDLAIAVWYMDDGNLAQFAGRSSSMSFATNSFSDVEVDHLCFLLARDAGISDARRVWSNGWRIRVGARGTEVLAGRIARFILPSLRYKLPKRVRGVPFVDVSGDCEAVNCHWEPRPLVEEVKCLDKSFYCLDVRKNHNFITTGGIVVHNCYTPGNRRPSQEEVGNCQDFLDREVKALQPKTIISLGGPAFEQLTGMNGILKHHGNPTFSPRHRLFVFPLLHPSPLNLNDPAKLELFVADLVKLEEFIKKGCVP